jgi:hypothetical protein
MVDMVSGILQRRHRCNPMQCWARRAVADIRLQDGGCRPLPVTSQCCYACCDLCRATLSQTPAMQPPCRSSCLRSRSGADQTCECLSATAYVRCQQGSSAGVTMAQWAALRSTDDLATRVISLFAPVGMTHFHTAALNPMACTQVCLLLFLRPQCGCQRQVAGLCVNHGRDR